MHANTTSTDTISHNDGLCSGGRRPRLFFVRGGTIAKFAGVSIPGLCTVLSTKYEKNGKWSNSAFQIRIAEGVAPIEVLSPLHGDFWGDCTSFASARSLFESKASPVSEEAFMSFLGAEYPRTFERLEAVEEALASLEEAPGESSEVEVIEVLFGSPTNRQIAGGYWDAPILVIDDKETVIAVVRWQGESPSVEGEGVRFLDVIKGPGMHGGSRTVRCAVPAGCRMVLAYGPSFSTVIGAPMYAPAY